MRWRGRQGSRNVEDRRGSSGVRRTAGGLGIVGVIIAVVIALLGGDPTEFLNLTQQSGGGAPVTTSDPSAGRSARENELAEYVSVVLKDTEDAWNKIFREQKGASYREPVLVLFTGSVNSACGYASAATGPFYCPGDQKLYIDLSFCDELERMGGQGDFALAYVIAHEVGHHVQNLEGTLRQVQQAKQGRRKADQNALQVRVELQADYYAGVWAHHTQAAKRVLEPGDIQEALSAANAVGDDRLQKRARGYVVPESFTHGTSAQRMEAFQQGYKTGDVDGVEFFR